MSWSHPVLWRRTPFGGPPALCQCAKGGALTGGRKRGANPALQGGLYPKKNKFKPSRQPLIKNLRPFRKTSDKGADWKCPQIYDFYSYSCSYSHLKMTYFKSKSINWTRIRIRIQNLRPLLDCNYPPITSQKWSHNLNQRLSWWWTSMPWSISYWQVKR